MKKFRIFVDMDKEEEYLKKMARDGYILKKYSSLGVYTFAKKKPEDLHYRIDYRIFRSKGEFESYKTFFEDAGWKHVCGTTYSGGQYFIPKSPEVKCQEIFSDAESKASRYKRFIDQCAMGSAYMLTYIVAVLITSGGNFSNLTYLTPGLWEKTGADFWQSFLFETPFVILRVLPVIIFMAFTASYGYWGYRAQKLYRQSLENNKNDFL